MSTEALKEEIVRMAGRPIRTPNDYEWLSERILERTHERLSPTTLKRFFGYLDEAVIPRAITLDILARFVGYRDFDSFCQRDGEAQSNIVMSERLTSDELQKGQMIRLTWNPDRTCIIRHLGIGKFEIIERENTKLEKGDIFECHLFINHEPLYINNIHRNGRIIIDTYLLGRNDGITFQSVPAQG